MKNRKTCITRLLVVFTLLAVVMSAVLIPSSATKAGSDPILSGSDYGITYNDGVYTISIDAERLMDILTSKSFDKETLLSIMPEKVYELLVNRDAASAIALLNDLIDITEFGQLKEDLPLDYFANQLSADEFIELIYVDKIIDLIDIKAVIASLDSDEIEGIFKEGALEELFKSLDLTPIITSEKIELLLDQLTTEEINGALKEGAISRLITDGAVDLHQIIDEDTIKKLFDEEDIITDEEIQSLMNDPDIIEKMIADEAIVNELLHHPDFLADIAKHPEVIEDLVTDEVIIEIFLDDGILDDFVNNLSASTIKEIVLNDKYGIDLSDIITADVIKGLDSNVLKSLISDEDIDALANMLDDTELEEILNNNSDLINLDNIDIDDIYPAYIDEQKIMDSGIISDADLETLANLLDAEGKLDEIIEKNMSAIDLSGVEIGDIYPQYVDAQKIMDAGVISTADIETLANILDASGKLELIVNNPKNDGCIDLSGVEIDDVYGTYITVDTLTSTGVLSDSEIQDIKDSLSTDDIIDIMDVKGYADPDEITAKDLLDLGYVIPQSLVDAGYIDLDADLDTLLGDKKAEIAIELDCIVFDNIDFTTIFPDYISADTLIDEGIIDLSTDIDAILGDQKVSVAIELDCIDFSKIDFTTIFPDYISASTLIDEGIIDLSTDLDLLFTKDEKIDLAIELDCIDFDEIDVASVYPAYITADELMSLISDEDLEKLDPSVFTSAGLTPSKVLDKVPNQSALIIDLYHDGIIDLTQIDFESMADKLSPEDRSHIVEEIKTQPQIKQHIIDMIQADIKELAHTIPVKLCYEKDIITDDMILEIISSDDINTILDKEIIKKEAIFNAITDMGALIDEVDVTKLPMDKLLSVFDMGELVDEVMKQNSDGLINALDFQKIIQLDAVQAQLRSITLAELKTVFDFEGAKNIILAKTLKFFNTDLKAVALNGIVIQTNYTGFDIANIELAMLDAIPTFDKIAEMDASGIASSFVLMYKIEDTIYTNGFQIVFTGDTTELKNYASKIVEYVSFKVEKDRTINTKLTAPAKLAELYVSAVDGTKLPAAVRVKLAEIANVEFNKSDIGSLADAITSKLTIAELRAVISAVNVKNIDEKLLAQLDLRQSQAQIILDYAARAIDKMASFIENNHEINVTLSSFYDKTLADFYVGDGLFTFSFDTEFDVMAKIEKLKELPDDIKMFFTNTTITHRINASFEVRNLQKVEFVENGDVIYTAFRTPGTPISNITKAAALKGMGTYGWDAKTADGTVITDVKTTPAGDIQLAQRYKAVFKSYNPDGTLYEETPIYFSEFTHSLADVNAAGFAPTMPAREHYTFVWDTYTVDEYGNFKVSGRYVPNTYYVTFMANGTEVAKYAYTIENYASITAPDVPTVEHYTGVWADYDLSNGGDVTVNAIYTPVTYTVTFVANGNTVAEYDYTIENYDTIVAPAVPSVAHYNGVWADYDLSSGGDVTVYATYTPITYTVTFVANGNRVAQYNYNITNYQTIVAPAVPDVAHYNGVWADYDLSNGGNVTVNAIYTPITYTVTFVANGAQVAQYNYNITNYQTIVAPAVPSVAHYNGVWADYDLSNGGNVTVNAIYTPITYTVTFVANGTQVAQYNYNITNYQTIVAPAVPTVEHYTGAWADYDLSSGGNVTVNAIYTAKVYSIKFMADGVQIGTTQTYTIEQSSIRVPSNSDIPEKYGYNAYWPAFRLEYRVDQVVEAVYVLKEAPIFTYYITFVDELDNVYGRVEFNRTTPIDSIEAPEALPVKEGYKAFWPEFKHLIMKDELYLTTGTYSFKVVVEYEIINYSVIFMADGTQVGETQYYTIENKDITIPAVPEKEGYTGEWEEFNLDELGDKVINAIYTEIPEPPVELETYYITFVDKFGNVIEEIPFTIETDPSTIKAPATVPELAGYNVSWPSFTLFDEKRFEETGSYSFTVVAVYEAINYTATFMADGKVVAEITFTVETESLDEPAIPEKAGYSAVWSSYTLGTEDITIDAIYSTISYKVTFVADGEEVAVRYYTVENKEIDEPAVPEKEGYTGAWEDYTLDIGDKTVNAVYTEITESTGSSFIFWWIMLAVLVAAGIVLVVIFFVKTKKKNGAAA